MSIDERGYEYILIAGCSRLGASIASMFSSRGKEVVVLDIEEKSFKSLSGSYSGFKIVGDATDVEVLKSAGVEKADLLVAATDDDNTNIMISEIAKHIFGVSRVISRIYDTEKKVVYRELDIDTIEPFELTMNEFERLVSSE